VFSHLQRSKSQSRDGVYYNILTVLLDWGQSVLTWLSLIICDQYNRRYSLVPYLHQLRQMKIEFRMPLWNVVASRFAVCRVPSQPRLFSFQSIGPIEWSARFFPQPPPCNLFYGHKCFVASFFLRSSRHHANKTHCQTCYTDPMTSSFLCWFFYHPWNFTKHSFKLKLHVLWSSASLCLFSSVK
jgi:hypothetical protein